ncbi:MAG: hypothetical protein ACR2PH_04395 [Desulfobulbia bacterium]
MNFDRWAADLADRIGKRGDYPIVSYRFKVANKENFFPFVEITSNNIATALHTIPPYPTAKSIANYWNEEAIHGAYSKVIVNELFWDHEVNGFEIKVDQQEVINKVWDFRRTYDKWQYTLWLYRSECVAIRDAITQ